MTYTPLKFKKKIKSLQKQNTPHVASGVGIPLKLIHVRIYQKKIKTFNVHISSPIPILIDKAALNTFHIYSKSKKSIYMCSN